MKKLIVLISLCLIPSFFAAEYLYLASGDTLKVHEIDQDSGKLKDIQTFELAGAAAFTFSPDKSKIYIFARDPNSDKKQAYAIATLAVADDGKVSKLHVASLNMRSGDINTDKTGNNLFGNHYREGKISNWKLEDGIFKGTVNQEISLEQKAHSVRFSADFKFLLVPATGPNKVFQLKYDASIGKLTPNDPPFAIGTTSGAMQPRHLIFSKKHNIAYTSQE